MDSARGKEQLTNTKRVPNLSKNHCASEIRLLSEESVLPKHENQNSPEKLPVNLTSSNHPTLVCPDEFSEHGEYTDAHQRTMEVKLTRTQTTMTKLSRASEETFYGPFKDH
jgi:hypothetical protein